MKTKKTANIAAVLKILFFQTHVAATALNRIKMFCKCFLSVIKRKYNNII